MKRAGGASHIAAAPHIVQKRVRPFFAALLVASVACSSAPSTPAKPQPTDDGADRAFAAQIDTFFSAHLAFRPSFGVDLGLHEYDGKVPDRSKQAIEAEVARLKAALQTFEAVDAAKLSKQ